MIDTAAERAYWGDRYRWNPGERGSERVTAYLDEIDRLRKNHRDTVERLVGEYGREIDRLNEETAFIVDTTAANAIAKLNYDNGFLRGQVARLEARLKKLGVEQ